MKELLTKIVTQTATQDDFYRITTDANTIFTKLWSEYKMTLNAFGINYSDSRANQRTKSISLLTGPDARSMIYKVYRINDTKYKVISYV